MIEDFEILALNGLTGECLTTEDFLEDSTQRLKETLCDPLEEVRQEHEAWLAELEGLAVEAIASGDWDEFDDFVAKARGLTKIHRISLQEFLQKHAPN